MSVASALRQLVERYGSDVGADPRRVDTLLRDLVSGHPAEIAAVVAAAEEGVPGTLLSASGRSMDATISRLVDNVARNRALTASAADGAVRAWATALGITTLPAGATVAAVPGAGLDATQAAPTPPTARAARPALPLPAILGGLAILGLIAFGLTRLIGSGAGDGTTTTESAAVGHRYPEVVVNGFIEGCMEGGASEADCRCLIDGIQAAMPLEEFVDLEDDAFERPPMTDIFAACDLMPPEATLPPTTTTTAAPTTTTLAAYTFERVRSEDDQVSAEAPTVWGVAATERQVMAATDISAWGAEYNAAGWKATVGTPGFRATVFASAVTMDDDEAFSILDNAEIPSGCTLADQISDGFDHGEGFVVLWLIDDYACPGGGRYSLIVEYEPADADYFIVFESYAVTQQDIDAVDHAFNTLNWGRP